MTFPTPHVSFTPQHQLADAKQEYVEAIYRFRRAEEETTADYTSAKLEMIRLEAKVRQFERMYLAARHMYYLSKQKRLLIAGCPKPVRVN